MFLYYLLYKNILIIYITIMVFIQMNSLGFEFGLGP